MFKQPWSVSSESRQDGMALAASCSSAASAGLSSAGACRTHRAAAAAVTPSMAAARAARRLQADKAQDDGVTAQQGSGCTPYGMMPGPLSGDQQMAGSPSSHI